MPFLVAFLVAVGVAAAATAVAGYYHGMYRGEIGRREAAERLLVYQSPMVPVARELETARPSETVARDIGSPVSEQAVEAGVREMSMLYEEIGRRVTPQQVREEVIAMLSSDHPFEQDQPG